MNSFTTYLLTRNFPSCIFITCWIGICRAASQLSNSSVKSSALLTASTYGRLWMTWFSANCLDPCLCILDLFGVYPALLNLLTLRKHDQLHVHAFSLGICQLSCIFVVQFFSKFFNFACCILYGSPYMTWFSSCFGPCLYNIQNVYVWLTHRKWILSFNLMHRVASNLILSLAFAVQRW